MTRDQIDELMRENGIVVVGDAVYALVQLVIKHEREACAKVCKNEEAQLLYQEGQLLPRGEPVLLKMASVANYCATAIRARGNA